ncbi:MAG: nucleotide pyrophosphohydrolase [Saprospiraceae bacterium]|nr:nucleotide pyrophosphohydrolase [Saprospiraceae bacterium]
MELKELQVSVDKWIKEYGVRYFDEKTNTLLLMEEVGEFSRLIARKYGEQSFKTSMSDDEIKNAIGDELGDVIFVLICLANQMELNIEDIMKKNIDKKTLRDNHRHLLNPKLK